ncbi:MAG TPA: M23 family metallopeptidase [Puia sp.]|nr:M23 family metallopeptidase [Puia sp.]
MKYLFAAAALFSSLHAFPQLFPAVVYPRNYFRDPLDIPISLAANFGELRAGHYHMGLDIRTQHRVNLPVYAAADGYIARVSVAPEGFGQAIYIQHPNGYTTVYGHLNRFFPALEAYVRHEQYRRESWQVNLELPPTLFPVKKGDLIARSGSTGGSQGPHLHFEIRRTTDDVNLNPLLFGLPVPDRTAPHIVRLAWYDRNKSIYEQAPRLVALVGGRRAAGGPKAYVERWTSPSLLSVGTTRISLAISAFDTQTGSTNPNGVFEATLEEDGKPVIAFQMNRISYDNTRNINAHIDYRTRETGGPYFQQLFLLQGYPLPSIYAVLLDSTGAAPAARKKEDVGAGRGYDATPGRHSADPAALIAAGRHPADGVLDIGDGRPHAIVIRVKDTDGNETELSFGLQYAPGAPTALTEPAAVPAPATFPSAATQPDGPVSKMFYPGMLDGLELRDCAFYLGEHSLYDSATIGAAEAGPPGTGLSLPGGVSAVYTIGAPWIPLLDPFLVRLRPLASLAADRLHPDDRLGDVVLVRFSGSDREVVRPGWKDGWASARFEEFGNFQLVKDTTTPLIRFRGISDGADLGKASRISVDVTDNLGETLHFRAELDGHWLCFSHDKNRAWIYVFDEHCPRGPHTLSISVEDVAGNKAVKELHFVR